MSDISNLNLCLEGKMVNSSPEVLERLKDALNGGYAIFSNGSNIMIFEEAGE